MAFHLQHYCIQIPVNDIGNNGEQQQTDNVEQNGEKAPPLSSMDSFTQTVSILFSLKLF